MTAVVPDPATTDWVPLGGIGIQGGLIPIAEILVPTGGLASFDFQNIPQVYRHLLLEVYARGDQGTLAGIVFRFNGDAGANYDMNFVQGAGASVTSAESFNATGIATGAVTGTSQAAGLFAYSKLFIPDYTNTANNKITDGGYRAKVGTAAGNLYTLEGGGHWRSNAAINRITAVNGVNSFVAGSRATLYGVAAPGVTYLPQATRVVSGSVQVPAVITAGTGFTVVKTNTGRWTITPTTPFASTPVVVGSPLNVIGTAGLFWVSTTTAASFDVCTASTGGAFTDYHFNFIAIGT